MRARAGVLGVMLACLVAAPVAARQAPAAASRPVLHSSAAILVNLTTDTVLYEREIHRRRSPASLTKVVTALVVRDRFHLDEPVVAGPEVLQSRGSRLGLEPGMTFSVRELLYALLLRSGNDVATVLAAHHPAGYDHFLGLMNEKARSLGAFNSNFANPHGLDAQGHYSTAWDMALFARRLMADPVLAGIVATPSYRMSWPKDGGVRSFANHNKLIANYPGTIGVKTGFTNQAGRCLIAAAETEAGTMLTVVMSAQDHYADTTALFEYGKAVSALRLDAEEAEGGSVAEPKNVLAAPPPEPDSEPVAHLVAAAPVRALESGHRWAAFMALLGAVMLATLLGNRRAHPLREAADFHPYLEPFVDD